MILPTRVILGSSSDAQIGPVFCSASVNIDLNLNILIIFPSFPTLSWEKNTDPLESNLIRIAVTSMIGKDRISPTRDRITSNALLTRSLHADVSKPGEKISQLGRKSSTAIFPVI